MTNHIDNRQDSKTGYTNWPRTVYTQRFISFVCGILCTLAQPPVYMWPLLLISIPVLISLVRKATSLRHAFLVGWYAGVGFFLTGLFWVGEAFLVTPEKHAWLLPFVIVLLPSGMAIFWGGMTALVWRTCAYLNANIRRKPILVLNSITVFAVCWMLFEYIRSTIFTGFAWALVAYSWMDTPVAQSLSLFGPYALGCITIFIFGMTGCGIQRAIKVLLSYFKSGTKRSKATGIFEGACIISGIAVFFALLGYGLWYTNTPPVQHTAELTKPVQIRLVQPDIKQKMDWTLENRQEIMRKLLSATRARSGVDPDIVVWPESSVPYIIGNDTPDSVRIQKKIADALPGNAKLIAGIQRQHLETPQSTPEWRNSMVVLDKSARITSLYDKHHLVPFGEYLPLRPVLSAIGLNQLVAAQGGFTAGIGPRLLKAEGIPDLLPLICYEAIFPLQINSIKPRARWMVHLTNDAWFGDTSGPLQHLAQAQARAIEQGLPIIRVANTGITAVIDSYGQIQSYLPLNTYGKIDAQLPPALPKTVYATYKELFSVLLIILAMLFILGFRFFTRIHK